MFENYLCGQWYFVILSLGSYLSCEDVVVVEVEEVVVVFDFFYFEYVGEDGSQCVFGFGVGGFGWYWCCLCCWQLFDFGQQFQLVVGFLYFVFVVVVELRIWLCGEWIGNELGCGF